MNEEIVNVTGVFGVRCRFLYNEHICTVYKRGTFVTTFIINTERDTFLTSTTTN